MIQSQQILTQTISIHPLINNFLPANIVTNKAQGAPYEKEDQCPYR